MLSRCDQWADRNVKGGMEKWKCSGVTAVHGKSVFLPRLLRDRNSREVWFLSDETGETGLALASVLHCGRFSSLSTFTQQPLGLHPRFAFGSITLRSLFRENWRKVAVWVELEDE